MREPEPSFNDRRRWATRLTFPLLALAAVVVMQALQAEQGTSTWPYWMGATGLVIGALTMLRISRR